MSAAGRNPAGAVDGDAQTVRRRQLVLFSVIAAAVLIVLAVWLSAGGGKDPAPAGGIEAELAGPDMPEKVWTRRSEARFGAIETRLREMQGEARRLGAENERLRGRLVGDAENARSVIDRQAAAISGTLADAAPERCTVQVIHWASPRFGAAYGAWAEPRAGAGGALARMGQNRGALLSRGGWRKLHAGGPPFTLSDYRVFVTACLGGGAGPAAETALGAFRRALEGTLASAGAHARRLEPDALLSLAAELTAPDIDGDRDGGTRRPSRRWSPRDPIHEQCIAPAARSRSRQPA